MRRETGLVGGVVAAIGFATVFGFVARDRRDREPSPTSQDTGVAGTSTEAATNLERIFAGAIGYFDADHADSAGLVLPAQFPASVPRTPADHPCGAPISSGPETWGGASWRALGFSLSSPHYYSYQFDSQGDRSSATFTVSAFGDLDCDGTVATFVRVGSVAPGNEIRSIGGLRAFHEDELEAGPQPPAASAELDHTLCAQANERISACTQEWCDSRPDDWMCTTPYFRPLRVPTDHDCSPEYQMLSRDLLASPCDPVWAQLDALRSTLVPPTPPPDPADK